MFVIVLGAPGVGKGTQANLLSQAFTIPHISTGDILRDAYKNQTQLGIEAHRLISKGNFVPDELVIGIIKETLLEDRCTNGVVLDGFPRTLPQAKTLDALFIELNTKDLFLVNLTVGDEEIIRRLTSRRTCHDCHSVFSLLEIEDDGKGPICGGENSLFHRSDDTEEVIKKRMGIFENQTLPVINYYDETRTLITVDGAQTIANVYQDIITKINATKL